MSESKLDAIEAKIQAINAALSTRKHAREKQVHELSFRLNQQDTEVDHADMQARDRLDRERSALLVEIADTFRPEYPAGALVWRLEKKRGPFGHYRKFVRRGIVEVSKPETVLPSSVRGWLRPRIGSKFVRVLKADGSPGLEIDGYLDGWTTVEIKESQS